ncbi:MAG: hypothetical protein ACE5E5_16575, partial [Phycisphaerae bacterium]
MSPPIVPGGAVPWAHDLEAAADGKAALRRTKHAISPGFRRGSDVRMTGRPVVGGAAILRAADRFSPEPGQGGVAGGPGSACVCDSDCDLDGSPCTADVCNLTTGLCEQTFALGVACVPANPGGADEMFCTAGQCDNAGTCLANDNGGSPCDAVTEACNEATDRCDGNECITDAQCAGGPADPLLCQTNVCVNGRCRLGTVCATGEQCCRTGDHCDVVEGFPVGACFVEQDGRCCDATQTCTTSTLAGCAGPWHIEGDLATPG